MGLENQGAKPSGALGKFIGKLMNIFHTSLYRSYFNDNLPKDNSTILDVGCGGGKFIKYLSELNESYQLFGIDHSLEMIELSQKVNKTAIGKNKVLINKGSVLDLPFSDDDFDLITAFETVQFWPDINKSFAEVFRVLNKNGKFLIINRYPKEGSKWWEMAKIKNEIEYTALLEIAGFSQVIADLDFKTGWIIVKASK